jgi:hypothetical protein
MKSLPQFYYRGTFESSRIDSLLHQTAAGVQFGFNGIPADLAEQFKVRRGMGLFNKDLISTILTYKYV